MFEKDEEYDESLTEEEWNNMYETNELVQSDSKKNKKKKIKKELTITPLEQYYYEKSLKELEIANAKIEELKIDLDASVEAMSNYKDYVRRQELEEDIKYDQTKIAEYIKVKLELENIISKIEKTKIELESENKKR